ncbi:hypothetical protein [Pandoravirus japonicus]|uniref:Uncharacterized protein n=1 Tax=Pandoravirus japonicus TaxID=2823154 RepID=A0A811BP87_9VIRU|nr:hypothetical protein [Pandoravirus japonicus]
MTGSTKEEKSPQKANVLLGLWVFLHACAGWSDGSGKCGRCWSVLRDQHAAQHATLSFFRWRAKNEAYYWAMACAGKGASDRDAASPGLGPAATSRPADWQKLLSFAMRQ